LQASNKAVLLRAADVIETRGWTTGARARTKNHLPCQLTNHQASSFCIQGAVIYAYMDLSRALNRPGLSFSWAINSMTPVFEIIRQLDKAVEEKTGGEVRSSFIWNDYRASQGEVVSLLREMAECL
jgi:hypothetical protein